MKHSTSFPCKYRLFSTYTRPQPEPLDHVTYICRFKPRLLEECYDPAQYCDVSW